MEFPRQEYWSGLPFPAPGDLPDPGIKPAVSRVSCVTDGFFITVACGSPSLPRVTLYILKEAASSQEAGWNNSESGNREYRWQRKLSKLISLGLSFPIDKVSMGNIIIIFILPGLTFLTTP